MRSTLVIELNLPSPSRDCLLKFHRAQIVFIVARIFSYCYTHSVTLAGLFYQPIMFLSTTSILSRANREIILCIIPKNVL